MLTMLLTSADILRPIASVSLLVIKQSSDAKLFSGGSVPAGPISGAGSLMTEDTVKPVTMFSAQGRI